MTRANWTALESYQPRAVTSKTLDHNAREVDRMLDIARGVPDPMSVFNATTFSKCMFVVICIGVVWGCLFAAGGAGS